MKQNGIAPVLIVIIVAILAVGGVLAYRFQTKSSSTPEVSSSPAASPIETSSPTASATVKTSTKPSVKPTVSPSPSTVASHAPATQSSPIPDSYQIDVSPDNGVQNSTYIEVPMGQVYYVSATITDSNGSIIKNQSDFEYQWKLDNTVPNHDDYTCFGSLKVESQGNNYGNKIDSPLPNNYAYFWAFSNKPVSSCPDTLLGGESTIRIKVIKKSQNKTVAEGQILAKIK